MPASSKLEGERNAGKRIGAVLGSGGHTAEMFRIMSKLEVELRPTCLFMGADDQLAMKFSSCYKKDYIGDGELSTFILPRPRKVRQTYFTSLFTTLWSLIYCIYYLWDCSLNVILCNGPGICVCVTLAVYTTSLLRWRGRTRIIYIESFARTLSLSVSGKVMRYLADRFIVQWPQLKRSAGWPAIQQEYYGLVV